MARIRRQAFIWIHRPKTTRYFIYIAGVDVTDKCISSEWTRAILGLESPCKLTLLDQDGSFADTYVGGETIELNLDFTDGTTSQWKGTLERPKRKFGDAYTLEIIGSHFQSDLLDKTVTESFTGTMTYDAAFKYLVDNYLTGYTYTSVNAFTGLFIGNFDNLPIGEAMLEIANRAGADCYLDSNKNFHLFLKESIENTTDAIVWGDNLMAIENLGTDSVEVKNKIIVYGEDDTGLPIIYETPDADAQSSINTYGKKELIIRDSSIKTYAAAQARGNAELTAQKNNATKGETSSIILPDINPGDMIWVTNPPQRVHGQFRIVKYTHFLPNEQTKTVIAKEKTIPQIFLDRKRAEKQLGKITNPYKMTNSYNFVFDDTTDIDSTLSSTVTVSDGNLKISSGNSGTMISQLRNHSTSITQVHIKVVGESLTGTTYFVSTDGGDTYQSVSLETLTNVTSGTQLRVKIVLTSTTTLIDSVSVLYK